MPRSQQPRDSKPRSRPKATELPQRRIPLNNKPPLPSRTTRRSNRFSKDKPAPQVLTVEEIKVEELFKSISLVQPYDQCWDKFTKMCHPMLEFSLFSPRPVSEVGKKLMKNGQFFVMWLKVLLLNPFINKPLILEMAEKNYLGGVEEGKQNFEQFIRSFNCKENIKTPPVKNDPKLSNSNLKRSILKSSSKKVQFGNDEIIYPSCLEYKQLFHPKGLPTITERRAAIRQKHPFVLDFFQINDIFLLEEVVVIGIYKEYQNRYGIIQVKSKDNGKEYTCIGVQEKGGNGPHNANLLQAIQKDYEVTGFLDVEDRDFQGILIDSIPTDCRN